RRAAIGEPGRMSVVHEPSTEALLAKLPPVRGRLTANAPIGRQTWFGVGGSAEGFFRPAHTARLARLLQRLSPGLPRTVIRVGSNLLVGDGGIAGITIRLGRGCATVSVASDEIRTGAATLDRVVAFRAAAAGIGGLEFLAGIPGSIGGSVRMNAGAYGREVKEGLISATALGRRGRAPSLNLEGVD